MSDARVHIDCRNFAPVDVAKGICHRTKEPVPADGEACEAFALLPRCRHCGRYEPDAKPFRGFCNAEPHRPMTYPDLAAVTCGWYEERG